MQGYVSEQTWRETEWWGQLALLLLWEKATGRSPSTEPTKLKDRHSVAVECFCARRCVGVRTAACWWPACVWHAASWCVGAACCRLTQVHFPPPG